MNEKIIKQREFILTRDMIQISIGDDFVSAAFTCPLPKGYKIALGHLDGDLRAEVDSIKEGINEKAGRLKDPFQNLLLGYHDRDREGRKSLLKMFKIERISIDDRGVYEVVAGGDVNSGDIYLSMGSPFFAFLSPFKHLLDENVSFCCHNVDFYWQALLTREFCVEYFNFLNQGIFEGD